MSRYAETLVEAEGGRLLAALRRLLAEKGIATPAEIAERIAATDRASPRLGAALVARAWDDPAFRALLLADGTAAAESLGIANARWAAYMAPVMKVEIDPARGFPFLLPLQWHMD